VSAALAVAGVSHGYGAGSGRVEVLHEVSLDVGPGEVVALAGPSGSGKTTLCHLAAGFESPERGSVAVAGRPAASLTDWSVVAVVPQQHGLLAGLSVADNVRLPALHAGAEADGVLAELAVALDLAPFLEREVSETSLGEQQRTAIARALVLRPALAVLDEPTGHQDDDHVTLVVAAIRAASAAGTAVLIASHDARLWDVADRVLHLDEGHLVR
jgi:ABC-type lipoprotein export system ATPase subunit